MSKKALVFFMVLLCLAITGCTQECILLHSEYYDITGKVLTPKGDQEDMPIFEAGQKIDKPCSEIGVVKVVARWGTKKDILSAELKKRARQAGADALVEAVYGEDKTNDLVFCGKVLSTKRNSSASAKAVIFTK
jgi:hypothetical protein